MNKQTRLELENIKAALENIDETTDPKKVLETLDGYPDRLQEMSDDERDKADNMPENMQMSERYDTFNDCADYLEDASADLQTIMDDVEDDDFKMEDYMSELKSAISNISDTIDR